jgi:hypothetical protein
MENETIIQGRKVSHSDINLINRLLVENPTWNRTRLSQELCSLWNWHTPNGRLKDMACRTFLLKLERKGDITLPARQGPAKINQSHNRKIKDIPHSTDNIHCSLKDLTPLRISLINPGQQNAALYRCLLSRYHYIGYKNSVGENMKYLLRDRHGRPLACLLFGSAAWKTGGRDTLIGWSPPVREQNLQLITNNTRFLILPWVKVPCLASHVLSLTAKRICSDWQEKYAHRIHLLETFVDRDRFAGTCYRAANWIFAGQTTGRSRNDRSHTIKVPVKDIYILPLSRNFRRELIHGS